MSAPRTIFVAHPSAMLTDTQPHGDGLIAWGYIRELAARGHELHVAVEHLDVRGEVPGNVHLYSLHLSGKSSPTRRVEYMWRMRRLFKQLQRRMVFDLVHQLNPVDVGMTLSLVDARVPVILGPYWPDFWLGPWQEPRPAVTRLKRMIRWAQQRRAQVVLLSTPAAVDKLEVRRCGRVRIRELSPGIDPQMWIPDDELGQGEDVLFLARIHRYKGIFVLLDAWERISPDVPGARLLIAGNGPEEEEVRRRITTTPALSRVRLLGLLERVQVKRAMQSCAVYCLPSYGEPFGMSALEAMACAKPVVATDAGGLRHLVRDDGGRRVKPGDAQALAVALRELLTDRRMRTDMGKYNRHLIEERYAWSHVIDHLEAIYEEALRGEKYGA